ncbi:MAG: hypothetical protein JSS32_07515 [Verrucomicrobia bacterium]|nr:hypothetical protein [Verrucomicrobiota bacterium]
MSAPVAISIPVHSKWVPTCLEKIIDKKISRVALTRLEKLVDLLCKFIYCPYSDLEQEKRSRILFFSDRQAILIDCTQNSLAGIHVTAFRNMQTGRIDESFDVINLRHGAERGKIYFGTEVLRAMFSRNLGTDYVAVVDDGANHVKVIEQKLHGRESGPATRHSWRVPVAPAGYELIDQIRKPYFNAIPV